MYTIVKQDTILLRFNYLTNYLQLLQITIDERAKKHHVWCVVCTLFLSCLLVTERGSHSV